MELIESLFNLKQEFFSCYSLLCQTGFHSTATGFNLHIIVLSGLSDRISGCIIHNHRIKISFFKLDRGREL